MSKSKSRPESNNKSEVNDEMNMVYPAEKKHSGETGNVITKDISAIKSAKKKKKGRKKKKEKVVSGNSVKRFRHLVNSTRYSIKRLKRAIKKEEAFKQELIMLLVLFPVSFFIARSFADWAILVIPLFSLLMVELLNSAIEATVDRVGKDFHKLSGAAKDMGSAAVFVNLVLIAVLWIRYLIEWLI